MSPEKTRAVSNLTAHRVIVPIVRSLPSAANSLPVNDATGGTPRCLRGNNKARRGNRPLAA